MMPPFVPGRATPVEPRSTSFLAPPLRLTYELEPGPPLEDEAAEPAPAVAHVEESTDDSLPWLVRPGLGPVAEPGAIDEGETPTAGDALAQQSVRLDLNDEWETDQLAVLEEEDGSAEDVFESDAELFARLFDELEGSGTPVEPERHEIAPTSTPAESDPRQIEEVAARLERIARSLRERGPAGPLAGEATDPLGALITGYLLGLAERSTPSD